MSQTTLAKAPLRALLALFALLTLLVAATAAGCGGGADIGQPCDTVGSADECVGGAVCTDEPGGDVCREICQEDTDCDPAYFCDSVPGSSEDTCQIRR